MRTNAPAPNHAAGDVIVRCSAPRRTRRRQPWTASQPEAPGYALHVRVGCMEGPEASGPGHRRNPASALHVVDLGTAGRSLVPGRTPARERRATDSRPRHGAVQRSGPARRQGTSHVANGGVLSRSAASAFRGSSIASAARLLRSVALACGAEARRRRAEVEETAGLLRWFAVRSTPAAATKRSSAAAAIGSLNTSCTSARCVREVVAVAVQQHAHADLGRAADATAGVHADRPVHGQDTWCPRRCGSAGAR